MFIKVSFLLLAVICNFDETTAYGEVDIECVNETCAKCYKTLATELLKSADNYIALQNTFFPPDNNGPDFVIVTYHYEDMNITEPIMQDLTDQVWFWSSSAYFFYHPLRIFQCTSLGFSDPSLRQRSISLHLPATCYESGKNTMKLLTQRLKLFAMHQKITGQVDSTYTAQSHSLETLKDWHTQNSHVSILVLSSQITFPIFTGFFLILYLVYLIECEPNNLGKKLNSQIEAKSSSEISNVARSKVWIIVNINILFTLVTIAADIFALIEYKSLPKEIEHYINDDSKAFVYLSAVPFIMLVFDVLSFISFILVPSILACCKYHKKCGCCKTKCNCEFKCSDLLYTLLSPFTCIATHSYHIIFAFINNPYHATSVLLLYSMTLFVVVVILQKLYYNFVLMSNRFKKLHDFVQTPQLCKKCVYIAQAIIFSIVYVSVILAMILCLGLTIAVLIVLPLNNAIDQASNQIYAIYQASVTVFAALVTFQVFFRETNSTFAVLIKAVDKLGKQSTTENWENMSEKEKEMHIGNAFLKHINYYGTQLEGHA